jgi:uncharacterized protein involved in outer membrane biogenesis
MGTLRKKILIAIAIFFAILACLYGAIYFLCSKYLTKAEIQRIITERSDTVLKRRVTIGDDVHFHIDWNLMPMVYISNVTLANLNESPNPHMLAVESIELEVDLLSLLQKNIIITGLTLNKPDIKLETIKGVDNWDLNVTKGKDGKTVTINEVIIKDGKLTYSKDQQLQQSLTINNILIKSKHKDTYFFALLDAIHDNVPLFAKIGITLEEDEVKLEVYKLKYGDSDLEGDLKIKKDSKKVSGDFESNYLNLETIIGKPNPSSDGEYSVPDTAIPVEFLRNSKVDVSYKIDKFKYHNLALQNFSFNIKSKDQVINIAFDPALKLGGGKLDLTATYDPMPASPIFTLQAKSQNIQFEKLFMEIVGKTPLSGSTIDINANLQGTGTTFAALVNSLYGKILITIGSGQYLNGSQSVPGLFANVLSGVITFKKSESSTAFNCGVMNFKVNNGIATANRGIAIEASSVNVLGNGKVDLRNGRIAFSIIPKNTTSLDALDVTQFSLAQAVTVSGTITKPEVQYNPLNLLNTGNIIGAGVAAGLGWQLGIASVAKDMLVPDQNNTIAACKTALAQ